jgi:integrase
MAELSRLHWNAIDLERGIIEVRAGQAKTASRRIIPISDNLRQWLQPLPRQGAVAPDGSSAELMGDFRFWQAAEGVK